VPSLAQAHVGREPASQPELLRHEKARQAIEQQTRGGKPRVEPRRGFFHGKAQRLPVRRDQREIREVKVSILQP
jgi:hypothetical protein